MSVHIVSLYASLLTLLFVGLSVRTLRMRRRLSIAIGDGGSRAMLRAMRVHSNFAEYVPLSLVLIFFVESSGASAPLVHFLGVCLLVGRTVHAHGVGQADENHRFRVTGMAMTFTTLVVSSAYLIYTYATGIGA